MSPPERKRPAPPQSRPSRNTTNAHNLTARRAASWRIDGGDPWRYEAPSVASYGLAARHLLDHGLMPAPNIVALREMWRLDDQSRHEARAIAEWWECVA